MPAHKQNWNISNEWGELSTIFWDSDVCFNLLQPLTALNVIISGAAVTAPSFPPILFLLVAETVFDFSIINVCLCLFC